jgi:hypothetical protein
MNKIIFLVFLIGLTAKVLPQEKENLDLTLTGNLKVDVNLISDKIKYEPAQNILQQQDNKKSPVIAALLSAAIPGAGEVYADSYLKAAIFFIVEVSAITANIVWNKRGKELTKEFQEYADAHWSPARYAEWLNKYASQLGAENAITIVINPDDSKKSWERVSFGQINKVEELVPTFSHRLIAHGEQQYYELIGKYDQYNYGWDYWDSHPDKVSAQYLHNVPQQMIDYSDMFVKPDNTFYKYASTAAIVIVINHVLSAIDAAWTTSRYNRTIETSMEIKRYDNLFVTDYYPQLNIKVNF